MAADASVCAERTGRLHTAELLKCTFNTAARYCCVPLSFRIPKVCNHFTCSVSRFESCIKKQASVPGYFHLHEQPQGLNLVYFRYLSCRCLTAHPEAAGSTPKVWQPACLQ